MEMSKLNCVLIIIACTLSCITCTVDDDGLGTYYQKSFTDKISAIMPSDSVHIIIEQLGLTEQVNEKITHDFENDASLGDTIGLILNVNFGSYLPDPNPKKDLKISGDTLYLWYASRERPELIYLYKIHANQDITGIETSPKLEYYNIEKAVIKKSPDKEISFESTLYQ